MIEVFKTDVRNPDRAKMLLDRIHHAFSDCKANFDLEDCDRILRVNITEPSRLADIIDLLKSLKVRAEILPDEVSLK